MVAAAFALLAACGARGGTDDAGTAGAGAGDGAAGGAGGADAGGASDDAADVGSRAGAPGAAARSGDAAPGPAGASTAGADGGAPEISTDGGSDADAGGAALTLPVVRGDLDVLEVGPLSFAVSPAVGARITSFKLDGDEVLTDATANAQYWGSTLWTSPASDWVVPGTFVPPAVVDNQPYATTVGPDGVITATSGPAVANGKHFVITKVFRADLARSAIVIDYEIKNTGTTPFNLAHWEVTRVFPGGLTFFPSGTMTKLDFLAQKVEVTQAQGYTWYDNTTHVAGMGESKAGSDSSGGFIAQVAPHAKGDLLFIKAFERTSLAAAPPGHYPIELYCNDPHTYVELEDHSAYDPIAPGATYTRTVTWYLRRLPIGTDRTAGSAALVAAVAKTLGQM
jgi:hypothetical protein